MSICGQFIYPELNPINLVSGWNMIAYLRLAPVPIDLVFADINSTGNFVIAKDYFGNAFLPQYDFNGIGDMLPGQGYQLKYITQMCFSTYLMMIHTECLLWKLLRIMYHTLLK